MKEINNMKLMDEFKCYHKYDPDFVYEVKLTNSNYEVTWKTCQKPVLIDIDDVERWIKEGTWLIIKEKENVEVKTVTDLERKIQFYEKHISEIDVKIINLEEELQKYVGQKKFLVNQVDTLLKAQEIINQTDFKLQ